MNENNSPSDAENQEEKPVSETATLTPDEVGLVLESKEDLLSSNDHGWLEQFDALKADTIGAIQKVAAMGLEPVEVDCLLYLSVKLVAVAQKHDPDAFRKVIETLQQLSA